MTNRIEIEITERFAFAEGATFGNTGAYERIKGRARYAVDPKAKAQAGICDIEHAPVGADGLVHFSSDISILKPVDTANGNGRLFFDWGNRGNIRCLQFFNDAPGSNDPRTLAHAGNGFFMRRGYTIAWAGWQGDLLPGGNRFLLDVPVATDKGKPITGPVRVEYIADRAGGVEALAGFRAREHPLIVGHRNALVVRVAPPRQAVLGRVA